MNKLTTKDFLSFGDKIANKVSSSTNINLRCIDTYVVEYNVLVLDFENSDDADDLYSLNIELDLENIDSAEDLFDKYGAEAVNELQTEINLQHNVDSSTYIDSETHYYEDAQESVNIELNDVIIVIDENGDYEYEDQSFSWVPEKVVSDEFETLTLATRDDIVECIDKLFEDVNIELQPGNYKLSGNATLVFEIENAGETREYYTDEDDELVYDTEGIDTSLVDVTFNKSKSSIDVDFEAL